MSAQLLLRICTAVITSFQESKAYWISDICTYIIKLLVAWSKFTNFLSMKRVKMNCNFSKL